MELLRQKKEEALGRIRENRKHPIKVNIGMATCEIAAGSKEVWDVFESAVKSGDIQVDLGIKGCAGRCNLEPTIEVIEEGKLTIKYTKITPDMAKNIIERHIKKGEPIEEYITR